MLFGIELKSEGMKTIFKKVERARKFSTQEKLSACAFREIETAEKFSAFEADVLYECGRFVQ